MISSDESHAAMSLLDHSLSPFDLWLDDLSDRLNPFVVRDVRVWLKGRWPWERVLVTDSWSQSCWVSSDCPLSFL